MAGPIGDLVSIVIPTYNRADYISEAVDSALNQTYRNIEVIVVDDGSTDDTPSICESYGSKIRYIKKRNGGVGSALNVGVLNMRGSWFKWLSSDDVLTPTSVEELIRTAYSPGVKIVYSDYVVIDEDGRVLETRLETRYDDFGEFCAKLWERFFGNGSSILIHKSCFERVGLFDEHLRFQEDYDWWLRASLIHGYRFHHVPKVLLKYRVHKKQLTAEVYQDSIVKNRVIKERIRRQLMSINPERWRILSRNIRYYNRYRSLPHGLRMIFRHSLTRIPSKERKIVLTLWFVLKRSMHLK